MKRYDIVAPRTYEKDGEEKTHWGNVGTLVRFDATSEKPEGFVLELNMFPGTRFMVFEQKPREENKPLAAPRQAQQSDPEIEYPY